MTIADSRENTVLSVFARHGKELFACVCTRDVQTNKWLKLIEIYLRSSSGDGNNVLQERSYARISKNAVTEMHSKFPQTIE